MEKQNKEKKLVTQKELAGMLGICALTVRKWKECPVVKISAKRHRYDPEAVMTWLKNS